ncbi:MAG: hypothetical protein AMXMBFR36_33490 [Acidobacteriota bacterium]
MRPKNLVRVALVCGLWLSAGAALAADPPADGITKLNVKLTLLTKLGADSLHVDVEAVAGAVTLAGTVEKRETRELAATVAKSVAGVTSVENDILLSSSEADPHKTGVAVGEVEAEVKDAILATKVRLALVDKLGSDGFRIGTEVADGVVTLVFDHDFPTERRLEANSLARGVTGVVKVVAITKS